MTGFNEAEGTRDHCVERVVTLARVDEFEGVSKYHSTNTGKALVRRVGLRAYNGNRNGDSAWLRQLYTAVRTALEFDRMGSGENSEGRNYRKGGRV